MSTLEIRNLQVSVDTDNGTVQIRIMDRIDSELEKAAHNG
jgi:ABC-type antimicrobial peptide transport system ATPase subunit